MNKQKIFPLINLEDYTYDLPKDRIAEFPTEDRARSKLLFAKIDTQEISHHSFSDICDLLPENILLVKNATKVISARLKMRKPSGGKAEILCVEPKNPSTDPQITMAANGSCEWECIIGGRKIVEGMELATEKESTHNILLKASIIKRFENKAIVKFSWKPEQISFAEILSDQGNIPLPPYIKRDPIDSDKDRYQTVYADKDGSVAAPTAGLHFTDEILDKLSTKGIKSVNVALHVGPGTFLPISNNDVSGHEMHSEQLFVERDTIETIKKQYKKDLKHRVIAVGTTSMRTLESLYWYGVKLINEASTPEIFNLFQWEPYYYQERNTKPSVIASMDAILDWMDRNKTSQLSGRTELFCVPSYEFNIVDGIITNYHIPKSTLILLVAAFTGKALWESIYREAIDNDYRFLSYGDSSFLLK